MHAFLLSALVLSVALCGAGLALSRLPRLSAATRHWLLSTSLLTPLLAIAAAAFDPPNPFLGSSQNAVIEVAMAPAVAMIESPAKESALPLLVWLTGTAFFLALTLRAALRWSRVARRATPFAHPAFDDRSARLAISAEAREPMVVGFLRPVVLLPTGYAETLDARELASVFAHELEHVRRRDNATAFLHEIVCALFWLDPLHWLARRTLLDLRERACDERVLESGCEPRAYIAALAKSCRAAIESSAVACMSGFHVRERMDSIMSYTSARTRFFSPRLVRWSAATIALFVATTFALIAPAPPVHAEEGSGKYWFIVSARTGSPVVLTASVYSPDGSMLMAGQAHAERDQATELSSRRGDIEAHVLVTPRPDGAMTATLEVKDAGRLVQRTEQRVRMNTELPSTEDGFLKIGGDVKAPVNLSRVEPVYPADAKQSKISGLVILQCVIDESGIVREAHVQKSLMPSLDQAAIDAVKQWRFAPATKDDKPVAVIFNLTISFRLN